MTLTCGVLLAGCVPAEAGPALAAADAFQTQVAAQDWESACGLLSNEARSQLEATAARSCREALPALRLPADAAGSIQVWGGNATARVGSGAVFLSRFADGWRIIAAGCASRGEDRPYSCSVRG